MIEISWEQLQNNSESKELCFETFCFQIAVKKYGKYGKFHYPYNTPGSEFYLILDKDCEELGLSKDTVVGWQAKFWRNQKDENNSPLDSANREILLSGFQKTADYQSNIKKWIICTPGQFSDTKTKTGKTPWRNLVQSIEQTKKGVSVDHWHKQIFSSFFLSDPEEFAPVFNHYFNSKFIGVELTTNHTGKILRILESKFDVDLHVKDETEVDLISYLSPETGVEKFRNKILDLKHSVENSEKRMYLEKDDFTFLSKDYVNLAKDFLNRHNKLLSDIECSVSFDHYNNHQIQFIKKTRELQQCLVSFYDEFEPDRKALNKYLKELRKNEETANQHWGDVAWNDDIIKLVSLLRDGLFRSKEQDGLLAICDNILRSDCHVFSGAGNGKTHLACSIAYHQLNNNKPVLLFMASTFKKGQRPQDTILKQLGLDSAYSFSEFLGALNNLGDLHDTKLPIIIDGLNESSPNAGEIWKTEVDFIIEEIKKYPHLLLVTTCRERGEYVDQIFGKERHDKVRNSFYLKGFSERNRKKAVELYFNKWDIKARPGIFDYSLFKHPLRLKIFCEVNKGKENIEVNLYSVFSSVDDYIELIIGKAAHKNGACDMRLRHKLRTGLANLGRFLWESGNREICLFEDFWNIFDSSDTDWDRSLSFRLLDEGLCFQRNLNEGKEYIQFSIDLIGGFQIAKSVFFEGNATPEDCFKKLQDPKNKERLFGLDGEPRHPLFEDVLKSLCYLSSNNIGKQIFEIYNTPDVLIEVLDGLELIAWKESDKTKLKEFIRSSDLSVEIKAQLLAKLFDDVFQRRSFATIDIVEDIFQSLTQFEFDTLWNEITRKQTWGLVPFIRSIVENIALYQEQIEDVVLFTALLTGSNDQWLRSEATNALLKIGLLYPQALIGSGQRFLKIKDGYVQESLIVAISGMTLRKKEKEITSSVVEYFKQFLKEKQTNLISIIDNIDTVLDFAKKKYDITTNKGFIAPNKEEKWKVNKSELSRIEESGYWSYEMMDYDFIKYQVTSLSKSAYDSVSPFTKAEIISLLSQKVKENGYSEKKYSEIEALVKDETKYRRADVSEVVTSYGKKYLNLAFGELAGYMMLRGFLLPEISNTLRSNDSYYDSAFPTLPPKIQLVNTCFLPTEEEDAFGWMNNIDDNILAELYKTVPLFQNKEMILVYGKLNQRDDDSGSSCHIAIRTAIFNNSIRDKVLNLFDGTYHDITFELYQILAGEISWRNSIFKELSSDNFTFQKNEFLPLVIHYNWSSWSRGRFEHPSFHFISPLFAEKLDLEFDLSKLCYRQGEKIASLYYHTDDSEFLFIDKELVDNYLSENDSSLMWQKLISKYAKDKSGRHTVKDSNKLDIYTQS